MKWISGTLRKTADNMVINGPWEVELGGWRPSPKSLKDRDDSRNNVQTGLECVILFVSSNPGRQSGNLIVAVVTDILSMRRKPKKLKTLHSDAVLFPEGSPATVSSLLQLTF